MKQRINRKEAHRTKATSIKTTFMELLEELSRLTRDDFLVMAAVRNIFATYNVVATRSLAPVKLVPTSQPIHGRASPKSLDLKLFR
jgi:hypothetical protein